MTGDQAPPSTTSRLNSSNPQLPSGRENTSTHRSCSKFSRLMNTNQDFAIRWDTPLSAPTASPKGDRPYNIVADFVARHHWVWYDLTVGVARSYLVRRLAGA